MAGGKRVSASIIRGVFRIFDRDSSAAGFVDHILAYYGLRLQSRAIVGSAKCPWVVDFADDFSSEEGFLSKLDSKLRLVNAIQTSLNDLLENGRRMLLFTFCNARANKTWESSLDVPSEASIPSYAVVVSAVVLLSLVYQYLTGNVDRGGSKAYSRSSLDFRDVYVAIVLFLGAYVWIKFRQAAYRGVYPRKLVDKQGGTKVVYEARLKPPMWDGKKVPRLDLGRFATPQEAHNKFLIAAFYYNRYAGFLDDWFRIPSMRKEEQSLNGEEKREWVIEQAKEVYKAFEKRKVERKEKEEAALLPQELLKGCEVQALPGHDEVNVDPCGTSLLNSAEPQQLVRVSQAENLGMGMGITGDNHDLECASQSCEGMHEGLALPHGHSLGFQEGSALLVSQLPPNTESGMRLNGSDQLDLLHTRLGTFQQQISNQQQQIQEFGAQILELHGNEQFFLLQTRLGTFQQQISAQQQQIQEFGAQILQLKQQQHIEQQQQLQESRFQNSQWYLQEQQLQDVNQGVSVFEMEMGQSMHQQNYPGLMAPSLDGGEAQEALWEFDTLMCM